jgi:hypothetical protein
MKNYLLGGLIMSNSSLVTYTRISPNRTSPRNHKIDTITIHCFVGQVTAKSGCNSSRFINYNNRSGASCNYVVGYDGSIGLCVEEKDRSWCTSNKANDHRAITIEVACEPVHPYKVTDKAMKALIMLCADICKRNNINKLVWSTNKANRVNHLGGCNLTVHRDYAAKACPGEYLYSNHSYIANEVNKLLGINEEIEVPKVEPDSKNKCPFKVRVDIPDLNIRIGAGTGYKKTGKYTGVGTFTIIEVKQGAGSKKGWGRLKSKVGWISLDYCTEL